jgi:hypothetical protein
MTTMTLFHGGVAGMRPGDVILPGQAEKRFHDDCPVCQAHKNGHDHPMDPRTPDGWVYASEDRPYARYYASRAGRGTLYRVTLTDPERSEEDLQFPTWRAPQAVVYSVLEVMVEFTHKDRSRLWVRWGGTRAEYDRMVAGIGAS